MTLSNNISKSQKTIIMPMRPLDLSQTKLTTIDEASQYLFTRKIIFSGELDEGSVINISEKFLLLNEINPQQNVTLIINSIGGDAYSGLYFYDFLRAFKFDLSTIVVGGAMSAAFFIVLAGTKGKRFITPNATIMQHQISSGAIGKLCEMEGEVEECKRIEKIMEKIIKAETRCPRKMLMEFKKKDVFLNAEQAVKYGIVDKIITQL